MNPIALLAAVTACSAAEHPSAARREVDFNYRELRLEGEHSKHLFGTSRATYELSLTAERAQLSLRSESYEHDSWVVDDSSTYVELRT